MIVETPGTKILTTPEALDRFVAYANSVNITRKEDELS